MALHDPAYGPDDEFDRLQLRVRCALQPDSPQLVRQYVQAGLRLERLGRLGALDVHNRLLRTLLATSRDEALPWFWRSVCLEHVSLPLARLMSQFALHDPPAARAIEAAVQMARAALPQPPSPLADARSGTPRGGAGGLR